MMTTITSGNNNDPHKWSETRLRDQLNRQRPVDYVVDYYGATDSLYYDMKASDSYKAPPVIRWVILGFVVGYVATIAAVWYILN